MVVGVVQMLLNKTCLRCKGRVEPTTPPLAQCLMADNGMLQRFDVCPSQVSAKLMFLHWGTLQACGKMVQDIAQVA